MDGDDYAATNKFGLDGSFGSGIYVTGSMGKVSFKGGTFGGAMEVSGNVAGLAIKV